MSTGVYKLPGLFPLYSIVWGHCEFFVVVFCFCLAEEKTTFTGLLGYSRY